MLNSFSKLLHILFPPRETQELVRNCVSTSIPYQIVHKEHFWHLTDYSRAEVRALMIENKFYKNNQAASLLGSLLAQFISDKHLQSALFVPIPLSRQRQRERGYNQVARILEHTSIPTHTSLLLERTKNTTPQTKLERSERLQNIRGAFKVNKIMLAEDCEIVVLLDDVCTTGATLKEARATLAPHLPPHIKLICLAIAH